MGTYRSGVLWPLTHEADGTLRLPGGQLGNEVRLLPNLPTTRLSPRNSPAHALKARPHSTGGFPVAIPSSDVASGLPTIPGRTSIGQGTQRGLRCPAERQFNKVKLCPTKVILEMNTEQEGNFLSSKAFRNNAIPIWGWRQSVTLEFKGRFHSRS